MTFHLGCVGVHRYVVSVVYLLLPVFIHFVCNLWFWIDFVVEGLNSPGSTPEVFSKINELLRV